MSRIIGSAILAVGIVCAPVMLAGAPESSKAQSQPVTATGDRLGPKPSGGCIQRGALHEPAHCVQSLLAPAADPSPTRFA
jgi:hypothetical protein